MNIKYIIRNLRDNTSEYHYSNCECGGKFKQKKYITTVGGIDEEQFYDLWKCKCTKCGKYKDLDFIVET